MRMPLVLLLVLLAFDATRAQTPYAAAPAAEPMWGGYALPAQVPYQPTLPVEPTESAQALVDPTWQAYPPAGCARTKP